jgi:hypothetical protein
MHVLKILSIFMHVYFRVYFPLSAINFASSNFLSFLQSSFKFQVSYKVYFSYKQFIKFISFSLAKSINLVCSLIREISEVVSSMRGKTPKGNL